MGGMPSLSPLSSLALNIIGHFRVPPRPLFQNEGRCSAFDMEIIFHCHANKTPFHKKGCAPSLILKVSVFGIRTVAYCCYIKLILGRVAKNGFEVSIHFSCFFFGREVIFYSKYSK